MVQGLYNGSMSLAGNLTASSFGIRQFDFIWGLIIGLGSYKTVLSPLKVGPIWGLTIELNLVLSEDKLRTFTLN